MTTALSLVTDAMQDLGVLKAGGTPSSANQTDCLRKLNSMLSLWSTSSLLVPFRTQVSHTLTGAQSYTIGSGGDINTTRPTFIDSAFVTYLGNDFPVEVLRDRTEYDGIALKTTTGIPRAIYYEPSVPLGTLYVYYVGDSSYTLYLNTRGQLTQFATISTDVDLAPGYDELIYSNLAINIAPMFEVSVSQELAKKARDSMTMVKRLNRQSPVMEYDPAIPSKSRYNIETG